MKNRCLILVSNLVKKTDKIVGDVCDAIIDIGKVPLLPIDINDVKSQDINISEMLMNSDVLVVVYEDDIDSLEYSGTEEEIHDIIDDAESIGKHAVYIDADREYESLGEYIKKALDYYEV